jgi:S-adenosylmethionine synthetase
VQLAYGIGIPDPISVYVNSFGTAKDCGWDDVRLDEIVRENFNMKAGALIKELELKKPQFKNTTCYGHFLKTGDGFKWEQVVDLSHVKK